MAGPNKTEFDEEAFEMDTMTAQEARPITGDEFVAAITSAVTRLQWSAEELESHRTAALRRTLALARDRSPFYRERLAGIDIDRATPADLERIEPTTKSDLVEQLDRIITRPDITTEELESHIAGLTEPEPLGDTYVFASSGSSGRRAISPMLRDDVVTNCGMLIALQAGQQRKPAEAREACALVIAGAQPEHLGSTTAVLYRLLGPLGRTEPVPASTPLPELIERAGAADPTAIMGFPSAIARLAQAQLRGDLNLRPEIVVSIGEPLTEVDAGVITAAWGCPIHGAYGCSELGWMAATTGPGGPLVVFDDQFVVEPLGASKRAVELGAESASVCFTTLERHEFPLIRYELADRVRMHAPDPDGPSAFSRIDSVLGRDDDWFRYGDIELHPAVFRGELLKHQEIDEYQVRQTPTGACVLAVARDAAPEIEPIESALREALERGGVDQPEVSVELVNAIDRQAGAKLIRFVPLPR